MFRVAVSLIVSVLIAVVPAVALAEDSPILARISKSGELRVAMSGGQPPLNARSKTGEIIGLEADLAALLAEALGVRLRIVERPFSELLGALRRKEVDMVMSGMTMTVQRNRLAAFAGPYFVSGKSILTKSAALAHADALEDINTAELKLAALKSSTSQRFVEVVIPKAQLIKIESYDEGVRMVINGEVDALVADHPICALSVLRNPDKGLATLITPFTVEPIGIALPPGDPLLVNLVENYLEGMETSGLLEKLRARWFEDTSWLEQLP